MDVVVVPILQTNYSYLLIDAGTMSCVAVDPGEAEPIAAAVRGQTLTRGLTLSHILCTHHHADHIGGAAALQSAFGAKIVAAEGETRIPADIRVGDGAVLELPVGAVRVLSTPGHTRGSVCYLAGAALFTGDTLFAMGCGRLFEGDAATMRASLAKISALPDETQIYPGHEYTVADGEFARTVEPDNGEIVVRLTAAKAGGQTVPFALAAEKRTNPFLRTASATDFAAVRKRKDVF